MAVLDKILAQMAPDEQTKFLRIIHECNLAPDSTDLLQAYLASTAMRSILNDIVSERKLFEATLQDLPNAIRSVGTDVAVAIGDNISKNIEASVVSDMTGILQAVKDTVNDDMSTMGNKVLDAFRDMSSNSTSLAKRATDRLASTADLIERYGEKLRNTARVMERRLGILVITAFFIGGSLGGFGGGIIYSKTLGVKQSRTACRVGVATILKGHGAQVNIEQLENKGCD